VANAGIVSNLEGGKTTKDTKGGKVTRWLPFVLFVAFVVLPLR